MSASIMTRIFGPYALACRVYVNDNRVGRTINMHLQYVFDISDAMQHGDNTLRIEIESATTYAQNVADMNGDASCKKFRRNTWPEKNGNGTGCSAYVRKNTGSFGWDCAPA